MSWRVWAGPSLQALSRITTASARGVKTQISVRNAAPYFAAAPIASTGQALASAATAATPAHVAIFGSSVFVPPGGRLAAVPAGCYTNAPCRVTTTVSAGPKVIARTRPERLRPNGTGLLFFKLTPKGRTMLSRAPGRRLRVQVTVRDSSGVTGTTTVNLIPFSTSGHGPSRSVRQASPLRIVGTSAFVSAAGVGGILAGCTAVTHCFPRATITDGRTTIATTRRELIGGGELSYLLFTLTPRGRALLAHATGNQLGARLAVIGAKATATARVVLVSFS